MSTRAAFNVGPLTTAFTPNPTCYEPTAAVDNSGVYGLDYGYSFDSRASSCYPYSYIYYKQNLGSVTDFYYSPGVCPSGWIIAATTIVGDETQAACCPTDYDPNGHNPPVCLLNITRALTARLYHSRSTIELSPTLIITGPLFAIGVTAAAVSIRFKDSDSSSSNGNSNISPTTGGSTSGSGSESAGSPKGGGLSTGAKIGIGIGIPLAVLLILSSICCLFLLRRSRKRKGAQQSPAFGRDEKPELDSVGNATATKFWNPAPASTPHGTQSNIAYGNNQELSTGTAAYAHELPSQAEHELAQSELEVHPAEMSSGNAPRAIQELQTPVQKGAISSPAAAIDNQAPSAISGPIPDFLHHETHISGDGNTGFSSTEAPATEQDSGVGSSSELKKDSAADTSHDSNVLKARRREIEARRDRIQELQRLAAEDERLAREKEAIDVRLKERR